MTGPPVAILPSLDEPNTIAGVTTAVDTALDDDAALIIHADASPTPDTAEAFRATPTRARTLCLVGLPVGKGRQVRAALGQLDWIGQLGPVLVADTDTRNPDPATYRALLHTVTSGASMALADYQRYWDEANLTNHLARPLIAAATGYDVPQPLAGDLALSPVVLLALNQHYAALPNEITRRVDGYGIDAFLLHTAASTGPVQAVRLDATKRHAPSFPHLPAIFAQAVPVLLHPATTQAPRTPPIAGFRLTDRTLPHQQRQTMLRTLRRLRPAKNRYDRIPWAQAVAHAWHAVAGGVPAVTATEWLWPAYLDHVHTWLTMGASTTLAQRAGALKASANDLLALLTTDQETPS
ncbi:MAG: hypothetical protein ACRDRI_11490 [Pseudonocardiaceae bacterium]